MISKKDMYKLEGLIYLFAMSKVGSKREVAEKLGSSVDTVNKYISDLEEELKSRFLVSGGRGTVVTPEGEKILQSVNKIIEVLHSLDDYADMSSSYRGIVRLSMPDAVADYIGTDGLFDFFEKYPHIHFENIITNKTPNMSNLEADICLDFLPPSAPDLVLIEKKEIKCALFAAPKYIEKYGMPKDLDDIINNHFICDKDNHKIFVKGWKEIKDHAKHIVYESNSILSLHSAMKSGVGIGISTFSYAQAENLVHIDNADFDFSIPIYLIAHKETKDMPRIRAALDYICDVFRTTP